MRLTLSAMLLLWFTTTLMAQNARPQAAAKDASGTYTIDPIHSSNVFRIKHMDVAYFHGRFNEVGGTFVIDENDPAKCSFDVRVKTDSIDTNNADRDKHLKSPDFFDAEKFPEISFRSTRVKQIGDHQLEVTGDLTLHGVTRPLTVKIERTGAAPGMHGEYRAGWETTFLIKRTDYGMKNAVGPVGDEVRLTVSVEGVRQ